MEVQETNETENKDQSEEQNEGIQLPAAPAPVLPPNVVVNIGANNRYTASHLATTGACIESQQDRCSNSIDIQNEQPERRVPASPHFNQSGEVSDLHPLVRRSASQSTPPAAYAGCQTKTIAVAALACLLVVGIALTIHFTTKDSADQSSHDSNNAVQANNNNNIVINNNQKVGSTVNNTEVSWGPWGPWSQCVRCAPAEQLRDRKCFKASGAIAKDVEDCALQGTTFEVGRACTGLPPCDPCKVHYRRKCFWLDFQEVNYTGAEEICRLQNSRIADIFSKNLYHKLVAMVKEMMPYNYGGMSLWTAMKMEFVDRNVTLPGGSPAPYVKWAPPLQLIGPPPIPEAANPHFARLLLEVDRFRANETGLSKYSDYPDGVLCQRDVSSFT